MSSRFTRRQFGRSAAFAAVMRGENAASGITGVTRSLAALRVPASVPPPGREVDLRWRPPGAPPGETWRYGLIAPFQAARGVAGVFLNIRREYGPGVDFEIGNDALLFDDASSLHAVRAVPLTRVEMAANPHARLHSEPCVMMKQHNQGGFVPAGALRPDGSPHPHAGTGFGLNTASAWPLDDRNVAAWNDAGGPRGRRPYSGPESHSYWELHQLAFDGAKLGVSRSERIPFPELLAGWRLHNLGLHNALPDGDDLLIGMVGGRSGANERGAGLARWERVGGRWQPASFVLVASDGSTEPTVVRDLDGSLLFCARGNSEATVHSIRVWRSQDGGTTWKPVIDVPGVIASSTITLNQAADGTPYVVGNLYEVLLHPLRPPFRVPRDSAGRPRLSGWLREKMYLWPLHADRMKLENPILVRDARGDFGTPLGGSTWNIDHPYGMTVQLRDGKWRHLLGVRIVETGEVVYQLGPTPQTGAYLEKVFSAGPDRPVWNFGK